MPSPPSGTATRHTLEWKRLQVDTVSMTRQHCAWFFASPMAPPAPEAPPVVVGTYAASSLHGGSTRVVAAKVALLPTLSGCVAGRLPSAQPAGALRTALTVSPSSSSCVTTRPLGGPSRRSSKGGWTPEEVRHMELSVCHCGGQGPAGAAPPRVARLDRPQTRQASRPVLRLPRTQPRVGRARAGEPGN